MSGKSVQHRIAEELVSFRGERELDRVAARNADLRQQGHDRDVIVALDRLNSISLKQLEEQRQIKEILQTSLKEQFRSSPLTPEEPRDGLSSSSPRKDFPRAKSTGSSTPYETLSDGNTVRLTVDLYEVSLIGTPDPDRPQRHVPSEAWLEMAKTLELGRSSGSADLGPVLQSLWKTSYLIQKDSLKAEIFSLQLELLPGYLSISGYKDGTIIFSRQL